MLFRNRRPAIGGQLGIEASPQGIALAQVQRRAGDAPQLLRCEYREAAASAQLETLRAMVEAHALEGLPVNFLLQPSDYQIFLLECPDVPPEELSAAMRWRVKDVITQPLDDVVIDSFPLPDDAYRGRTRMAYCVMLPKARMNAIARLVEQAGLRLASIDIGEMASRNLGLLAGAEGINLALLQLRADDGLICVQHGADVYMARRIEHGLARAGQDLDGITLEIQRSLDYFESQLGRGYIARMLLLPMEQGAERTHQALASGLAVNLLRLTLADLFPEQAADLPEGLQARCIGAVGAALREGVA